ncbi:MAG: hypothetical protein LBG27_02765 [Spirochaetaceae bacterium]|jgi:hypothetical protein|nr:hypothetical protein [Spirochaetaceae bacterium]
MRTLAFALLAACALSLFAQEGAGGPVDISKYRNVSLLNAETYAQNFTNKDTGNIADKYVMRAIRTNSSEVDRVADIDGQSGISSVEEIALLSATAGVINVRPIEVAEMLPASDPALIDLQLGAMLYMKKATVNFLGGGNPAKYATEMKFITDRGRVTEADIKDFVKQGIAAVVDKYYSQRGMLDIVPSVVYAEWKQNGASHGLDGLQIVKDKLTAFYLAPTQENYAALVGIYVSYRELERRSDPFAYVAGIALYNTLEELSKQLWSAVINETRSAATAIAAAGNAGRNLSIFSLPYATGR